MAVENGINYDYENCRCHHNGVNHRWREPDNLYRCTIPECACSVFTPLLNPAEIQDRNELLRSNPRQFLEINEESQADNDDPEAELVQGPYRFAIRETFDRAKPVFNDLEQQFDQQLSIADRKFILTVLADQTLIAMKWSGRQYRKKVQAWKKFCKAWDELCRSCNDAPTLDQLKDVFKSQTRKGVKLDCEPEELWSERYKKWPPWFEEFRQTHHLPMPETKGKRGRPNTWLINIQAEKLENYFREQTGFPQREIVGKILNCAPVPEGVSMDPERIRERKRRQSKEERHKMRLAARIRVGKN